MYRENRPTAASSPCHGSAPAPVQCVRRNENGSDRRKAVKYSCKVMLGRVQPMSDREHTAQGKGIVASPRIPREETARLGDELYERDIRPQVEADHHGEVVAIDVESGSWAIGDNVIAATDQLRAQRPGAIDVWLLRVGSRALHHLGGRPLRRAE